MSVRARRALISTADKSGLPELVRGLVELDIEILSTGGTAAAIRETGLAVTEVADITGSPRYSMAASRPCTRGSTGVSWQCAATRFT